MDQIFSYGTTLTYKKGEGTEVTVKNIQSYPELGNNAPEKVDVTTLSDTHRKYKSGIIDTNQDLAFGILYDQTEFLSLSAITESCTWTVTLADGTKATFAATPSVKLDGKGVNEAKTFTLTLGVESKIEFANA